MSESNLVRAINSLREGKPIFIYDSDSRERETDIVMASEFMTPEKVRFMRKKGGGLICMTISYLVAKNLGIDYLVNIYKRSKMDVFKLLYPNDIKYDTSVPTFSITINHRNTFTGISDIDRALTIREFSKIVKTAEVNGSNAIEEFGKNFRAPGHVHLLIASKGLLDERIGHTELSIFMVKEAGLINTATIVEMLGDDGKSMRKENAMAYAAKNGIAFVEGKDILRFYRERYMHAKVAH